MKVIAIKNCSVCPHCDHSGAFTVGGSWPVCHGPNVVDWKRLNVHINYNDPNANTKWSPPILPVITKLCRSYDGTIPEWCPLPDGELS